MNIKKTLNLFLIFIAYAFSISAFAGDIISEKDLWRSNTVAKSVVNGSVVVDLVIYKAPKEKIGDGDSYFMALVVENVPGSGSKYLYILPEEYGLRLQIKKKNGELVPKSKERVEKDDFPLKKFAYESNKSRSHSMVNLHSDIERMYEFDLESYFQGLEPGVYLINCKVAVMERGDKEAILLGVASFTKEFKIE